MTIRPRDGAALIGWTMWRGVIGGAIAGVLLAVITFREFTVGSDLSSQILVAIFGGLVGAAYGVVTGLMVGVVLVPIRSRVRRLWPAASLVTFLLFAYPAYWLTGDVWRTIGYAAAGATIAGFAARDVRGGRIQRRVRRSAAESRPPPQLGNSPTTLARPDAVVALDPLLTCPAQMASADFALPPNGWNDTTLTVTSSSIAVLWSR